MLTTRFFSSSLLLLHYLAGSATANDPYDSDNISYDDIPDYNDGDLPPYDPGPQAPPRPCDTDGCRDPSIQLSRKDVFPDQDIFLIVFGRPGRVQSSPGKDIGEIFTSYVNDSLPYLLKQLTPTIHDIPALVQEGAPLIVNAVFDFVKERNVRNPEKLKAWTKKTHAKAPCDLFAAATLPILEVALDVIYFLNNPKQEFDYGQKPTSNDLDYFIQPAFGPISHRDGITIRYDAKFPAIQDGINIVNHARDVFVRGSDASQYRSTPTSRGNPEFFGLVLGLLDQFGILEQWAAVDYLDDDMDLQYLLGLCKANYRFKSNKYMKAASKPKSKVHELIYNPAGKHFFEVWTRHSMHSKLGLPMETKFSPGASHCSHDQTYTLKFERGDLQVSKCGGCSRTVIQGNTSNWTRTWSGNHC